MARTLSPAVCGANVVRPSFNIAISDDKVVEYNTIAVHVNYDWALEINNDQPASDGAILAAIQSL
jgi:hypothetical protein